MQIREFKFQLSSPSNTSIASISSPTFNSQIGKTLSITRICTQKPQFSPVLAILVSGIGINSQFRTYELVTARAMKTLDE